MSSPSGDAVSFAAMVDGSEEQQAAAKRKRNLPGTPDPQAEVIALSPKTLMATNRFLCEVCGKGFQRDQNLQLHRRGHNLPWKLKQRDGQEIKKRVYVCPEATCVHHHPSRALGDLTGIKKHFSRKHGEKKWKCEKCSKRYAVHSDWKAHQKVCGTREYRCDCGTVFSRRDSFITHRAFCEALVQENARMSANQQVETRQSSGLDGNVLTSPAGEPSSATQTAPSSPLSQHTTSEHINAELVEPLVRDIWEPNATLNEARVFPSTSRSVQGGLLAVTSHTPSAGPGLSLCLGTGLGPGPPCMSERINCVSQAGPTPASKQMNKLVGVGSQRDESTQWQLPLASAGIFTSMLTAANSDSDSQGYALGRYTSNGMDGLSMGINSVIGSSSASSQFAKSTFLESGFVLSKHPRQHAGSAQLPATTLLQKAAMMGSTKSSSFMFRNIGLGGEDLGSLSTRESQQHDSWAGSTSSLSSSWRASLSMKPAAEGFPGCVEIGGGGSYSTSYGRQDNVQEFRDSGGAPRLEDVSHVASSSLNTAGDFMRDCNRNYHHMGRGESLHEGFRTQDGISCTELEGSQRGDRHEGFRIQDGISCTELEGSQRGDRHEANRLTLDFLGLGGHSRSVGVAMGIGEDLIQRDPVSINLLNAGIKPEPLTYLEENMGTRIEGDSPLSEG